MTGTGELNNWGPVNNGYGVRPISDKNKKVGLIYLERLFDAVELQQLEQRQRVQRDFLR